MRANLGVTLVIAVAIALSTAAQSWADPATPDASFAGGVALVPGTDHVGALGAPIVQSGGRTLVAGLLADDSFKSFVAGLDAAGSADASFGTAGESKTGTVAPYLRAAVAPVPGGGYEIVSGSDSDGTVTVQRYGSNGAPDVTFGTGGKLTAKVPNSKFVWPTAAVVLADGSTIAATKMDCGSPGPCFGLIKLTRTGFDTSFGQVGTLPTLKTGWVKTDLGRGYSRPLDLAMLSNGKILVAGSLGWPGDAGADTVVVRYTSAGAVDTSSPVFGTAGKLIADLGAGQTDWANAIVGDATGGFTIAGRAGSQGIVARYSSTGAPVASVRDGFAAAGRSAEIDDIAATSDGKLVAVGHSTEPASYTNRWLVARLDASTLAFDASFGASGVEYDQCSGWLPGIAPTGVTVESSGRISIAGNCGQYWRVAVMRLLGTKAFPTSATVSVTSAEAAGHQYVRLSQIDPATVLGAVSKFTSTTLGSGPMGSGPMGSGPMGSGPMGSGPMGSGPMGSGPMGSGPMGSGPMGSGPMGSGPMGSGPLADQILLSQLPLLNGSTWETLLAPLYAPDQVPPLQTITLGDVYRLDPSVIDSLTYGDVDLTRTPLRYASLAAVMLTRPLQYVAAPAGGWCTFLAGKPRNCGNGADITKSTLLELEFAGDNLSAYYAQPLSLLKSAGTDLGTGSQRSLLAYLDLRQVDVSRTPLGSRPASQFAALLSCTSCDGTLADRQRADVTGWTKPGTTIGDLVGVLNTTGIDLSLGQLLAGMVNVGEIPYEQAASGVLLAAADLRGDHLLTYTTTFKVDCAQAAGLRLTATLADNARLVPGSATIAVGGAAATPLGDATAAGGDQVFDLSGACAGHAGELPQMTVKFLAEPGSTLGADKTSVALRSDFGTVPAIVRDVLVDDSLDPGDATDKALPLTTAKMVHGWISSKDDLDYYSFDAPPAGTVVSITMRVPADFDLQVIGPGADIDNASTRSGPMGSGPMGSGPMGSGPVPDSTGDAIDQGIAEPDTVGDLPMGSGPMGSGPMGSGPMGSGSINRGTKDEAVTVLVRQSDVGGKFLVRVAGFNGTSSDKPYLLRRVDLVPPPAPPCPARTVIGGTKGTWPSSVPNDTEALYLVNAQRLAATSSQAGADDVMAKLGQIAARTKGVVVPVESDPATDTAPAYGAWDGAPCNEEKANDVAEKVNAVVDDVRAAGNGLKKLRSITIVGPDIVVPQIRLRDDAVLSNEREYADDARFGANDDAVSGALRDGYMLTDDGYGDFDPTRTMYLPDVALGRLVETPKEISDQIQQFLDTNGVIDPGTAAIFGYDLFADGAQAAAAPFGVTADVGNWNAATALAAINRNPGGITMVNGHYDSYRGLPSAAFYKSGTKTRPDFLYAADAAPRPGSFLFTMGCHAGLNISARVANPTPAETERLGDWAQRISAQGSLWAASTTFSYGDTEVVAYTEQILADTAGFLSGRQVTVGQALMYGKQHSLATVGVLDKYYTKSSMAATLYGLPMYRITASGGQGESGMPTLTGSGAGTQTSEPLNFPDGAGDLSFTPHNVGSAAFWTVGSQPPTVVQNHPVQPAVSVSKAIDPARGRAHGYLIEGLKTEELTPAKPVIADPAIDLASHEPKPVMDAPLFPARLSSVMPEATVDGRRDRITLAAGQYRGDHQRLFRQIRGRVMRSTGDDDTPVAIRRVDGAVTGNVFTVRVETEGPGATSGNVMYRTDADTGSVVTWRRANLAPVGGGVLATGGSLPGGATKIVEAFVQVVDSGNNVTQSNFKVEGYSFSALPDAAPPAPVVKVSPDPSAGYLTAAPSSITLDPGGHSTATFEYSIDGGPWRPYEPGSSVTIPAPIEGHHLVSFRGSDGSEASRAVSIDLSPPVVTAEPDRAPNANGWYDGPVTATFTCADAVSGVAVCPAPKTVSTEGANQSVTGSATDVAGHTGSGGLTGLKIDLTNPGISGSIQGTKGDDGWYLSNPSSPVLAKFACTDALSGIDTCTPDVPLDEGSAVTAEGTAVDRAGRRSKATAGPAKVDARDPSVAITTADGAVLLPTQMLSGTASDTATGSGVKQVTVTYTPTGLGVPQTKTATLECNADHACTWTAAPPSFGSYRVTATATEFSGRTATSPPKTITIALG